MTPSEQLQNIADLDAGIEAKSIMLSQLEQKISERGMSERVKALRKELNDDIDYLIERKQEAMKLIDSAKLEPVERKILYLRYLCMLKWDDIAKKVHYSEASVHRKHNDALAKLDK